MKCLFSFLFIALLMLMPLTGEAKVNHKENKSIQKSAYKGKNIKTGKKATPKNPAVKQVVMSAPEPPTVGPSEVIGVFYRTLTNVMKEGNALGFQGRYQKLEAAVDATFSSADMTRVAYGMNWAKATPEQQDKLTRAFRNFTVANYASQFKAFDGEEFTVIGEKAAQAEGQRIVQTTLKSGTETHELNYLMVKTDNGWKITDVFVDGAISEMATRRSEFGSVVRASGPEGLLGTLEQKTKQMGP